MAQAALAVAQAVGGAACSWERTVIVLLLGVALGAPLHFDRMFQRIRDIHTNGED